MTSLAPATVRFRYRALDSAGNPAQGVVEATTPASALRALANQGLFATAVTPVPHPARRRTASTRDLARLFENVAALTRAGVPIERALAASAPLVSGRLKLVLNGVASRLREGATLAEALEDQDGTIPPLVIGIIRAGERGSRLDDALDQVTAALTREAELTSRVRQALAYPLILLVTGSTALSVIAFVVIPRFAALLQDLGQQLPTSTRLVLEAGMMVQRYGLAAALALVALVAAVNHWLRTPAGQLSWHTWLLATPAIGGIRLALATARVSHALGGMLHTGMPFLKALHAAGDASGDRAVVARLEVARAEISNGRPVSSALQQARAVTPDVVPLYVVGESTGRLAEMALRASHLASRRAEARLNAGCALLEPALVLLFGVIVAVVAAALLQAVYSLRPGS